MAERPITPQLDLVPSLDAVVRSAGLIPEKLVVALETDGQKHVHIADKHLVSVSDGRTMTRWHVPSLRELFRGNRPAPPDIDHYPPEYVHYFFFIETQVLTICDAMGDRTDQELEEIYSALRRRPDGRSVGIAHDFVWQVTVLLLGLYPLSETEFEGLIGALVRSTRKWALRPVSRNYVTYLRDSFGGAHSSSPLAR